jgi:hypothetical protein
MELVPINCPAAGTSLHNDFVVDALWTTPGAIIYKVLALVFRIVAGHDNTSDYES